METTSALSLVRQVLEQLAAGHPAQAVMATIAAAGPAATDDLRAIEKLLGRQLGELDRLRAQVERFERVADAVSDAVWDWDLRDDRVWRNTALSSTFGYPPEDLAPTVGTWTSAIHPDDRDEVVASLRTAIDGDERVWTHEYRMLRHDGSVAHVSDRNLIVRDDLGAAIRVVGGITDISPRWEAEQALRLNEARYRELAEHSSEGIFVQVLYPDRSFAYINPAMEAMVGYAREKVYADPSLIVDAIPDADRARMWDVLERSGPVTEPVEVDLRHRDGRIRRVRIRGVPLRDATGRVRTVQAAVTDVTFEHREQVALRQALEQQRELSDIKTGFVQAVSHELRTPLTSIRGFVELLLKHELEPEEAQRYLQYVASGTERLYRLVTDVLDLDRFESAETALDAQHIELADLVRRVVQETEPGAHPLQLDLPPVVVRADAALLERVVDNLVRNAFRHTPETTPVRILTRAPGTIVIEDAGPGVPADLRDAVFEPFRQGPGPRSRPTPGIGIGLALARRIVRLHGGEVMLDERPGGGSRFTVTLPGG